MKRNSSIPAEKGQSYPVFFFFLGSTKYAADFNVKV
jgi:hypothetical protein